MERVISHHRGPFPHPVPHFALRASSILLACASAVLLAVAIVMRFHQTGMFSLLLAMALAALCLVAFLHTRFLLLARKDHRQTANMLGATETEFENDRQRWEISLTESEARFQQMANNIQEIFWMIDADTRKVIYVNQAFETIAGLSRQKMRENPSSCEDLIHPDDRDHILTTLREATHTGQLDEKFRILRSGGKVRWIWVRGFPVHDASGSIRRLVGTAHDITAQREAEDQTAANLALAESAWAETDALRKATLALTQDLRMDFVLDTLLDTLRELVPYEAAQILLVEAESRLFLAREAIHSDGTKQAMKCPFTINATEFPVVQRILATQTSVLFADTKQVQDWHPFKGQATLRSWLCVPLVASQRILGLLALGHSVPGSFTQEHLRHAKSLAIPAAVAIQNARLYERAEIYGAELERRLSDLVETKAALEESEAGRRNSEEKFQSIFRSSPIPFSITTLAEGRYLDVNKAFERRYGYSREEVLERTVFDLMIWEDSAERARLVTSIQQGVPIRNIVTRVRTKTGDLKTTTYSAESIQLDGQACLLIVSEDTPQSAQHRTI